jgi:hypothetical protein
MSVGVITTLILGILSLYVLVYAYLASMFTASLLPNFRFGFIIIFLGTSALMIFSSLAGIYGIIHKKNQLVIFYSITMFLYFVIFLILSVILIIFPSFLQE